MGDIGALVEIETQLRELGLVAKIAESRQLSSRDLSSDLVLIGGPAANAVTRLMMEKLSGVISYGFVLAEDWNHEAAVVRDVRSGGVLAPHYDQSGKAASDHALIMRTPNPLAPDTADLVIIAGGWEQGAAAAAEKLGDRKFLNRLKKMRYFEALVETMVVNGAHYNTKVVEIRETSERRRPDHVGVTVTEHVIVTVIRLFRCHLVDPDAKSRSTAFPSPGAPSSEPSMKPWCLMLPRLQHEAPRAGLLSRPVPSGHPALRHATTSLTVRVGLSGVRTR